MTGVEIVLLLAGCVFMIGSFFVTEKLSPSELNKLAELSEAELKKIVDKELKSAAARIDETIEGRVGLLADNVDRALEKETNEKIMAINEYSDTVIQDMNKTHNEIMFLYSMLNDKHTEMTGMASDLQRLSADIRNLHESIRSKGAGKTPGPGARAAGGERSRESALDELLSAGAQTPSPSKMSSKMAMTSLDAAGMPIPPSSQLPLTPGDVPGSGAPDKDKDNHNTEILELHKEGQNEVEIAKKLGLGIGEVRLVIGLYKEDGGA